MTEKEKAQELVDKYKDLVHGYVGSSMLTNTEYPEQILAQAKRAAMIVVDEIIEEIQHGRRLDWITEREKGREYVIYWASVRGEILKAV